MKKIIAIVNEKGGVGKTTTTMNLGAALTKLGKKVLLVDLDQQGNLSTYLGFESSTDRTQTISDVIYNLVSGQRIDYYKSITTSSEGIDYMPSSKMLAASTSILGHDKDSQGVLRRMFSDEYFNKYEYILVDCKPSLDILVVNALVASDEVIIPVQAEKFSVDGVYSVIDSCNMIRPQNPNLKIGGILVTMHDVRTNISKEVEKALRDMYKELVFITVIPRLVEASVSTLEQKSLINNQKSRLGQLYINVAEEMVYGNGIRLKK